ncbi:MAG: hypothetical protein QXQ14_03350 [Candidatus Aenigmatarchaeota archaeon]
MKNVELLYIILIAFSYAIFLFDKFPLIGLVGGQYYGYCTPSDSDNGNNPYIYGEVTDSYCNVFKDYCFGICNKERLTEYYLVGNDAAYQQYDLFSRGEYCKNGEAKKDNFNPAASINPNTQNWQNKNLLVALSCTDYLESGCKDYYYRLVDYLNNKVEEKQDSFYTCDDGSFSLTLSCNNVCMYRFENYKVRDYVNKETTISSNYYCIDKKLPYFVDIQHKPELISNADNTYDPYPNYYINKNGYSITLTPDKLVIDKEYIEFTSKSRDEYRGQEISGISFSSLSFNGKSSSQSFPVNGCPNGAAYIPPATHIARFSNLNVGWGNLNANINDQAGNSASNNNYRVYIFLGARGDQQNQRGTDKIVFLKTYWESSNEVKTLTQNLAGLSSKKINCFGYSNKCTQIRDVIGKTDEFTDCLWVGPSHNPTNVRIYNFKEGVDLIANDKVIEYKSCQNYRYCNQPYPGIPVFTFPKVNQNIAFCSKNDTGILVDLPNLVSEHIVDGFQILPSTRERFSVIWEVKYAREQREVFVECYLNPRNAYGSICTIDDILNGNCNLQDESLHQKCKCSEGFPCKQDTSLKTIHSCSVENPLYFQGINRIICKMYDPKDKGVRAEVWFNHEFIYLENKDLLSIILNFLSKILSNIFKVGPAGI